MGTATTRKFCKDCGQQRPFTKQTVSHLTHVMATSTQPKTTKGN